MPAGMIESMVQKKTFHPCAAPAFRSGIASMMAETMTQPTRDDHITEDMIALGTEWAAFLVSSDVWAEASYPVMV
jgi:hypothetical protein